LADCRALFSADLEFAIIIGFSVSLGVANLVDQ